MNKLKADMKIRDEVVVEKYTDLKPVMQKIENIEFNNQRMVGRWCDVLEMENEKGSVEGISDWDECKTAGQSNDKEIRRSNTLE